MSAADPDAPRPSSPLRLSAVALSAGLVGGALQTAFRWTVGQLSSGFWTIVERVRATPAGWLAVVVVVAGAGALAAAFASRFFPEAAPGALPRSREPDDRAPLKIRWWALPVNFLGTGAVLSTGWPVGPETPGIQIGRFAGRLVSRPVRLDLADARTISAAGGASGLGVAFDAPLGATIYMVERNPSVTGARTLAAPLAAGVAGIAVSRMVLGSEPLYACAAPAQPGIARLGLFVLLGAVVGLLGGLYARAMLGAARRFAGLVRVPLPVRVAAVGCLTGLLALLGSRYVGPGDVAIRDLLAGAGPLGTIAVLALLRFVLPPLAFGSGAPGGLFTPALAAGAAVGALFAAVVGAVLPSSQLSTTSAVVVGMGAFLGAALQVPITAVVLTLEATQAYELWLPMAAAVFAATTVSATLQP
ncbi:MAG: chloride channel protein, partial [Anaeromyxobacteraceae bacterium]